MILEITWVIIIWARSNYKSGLYHNFVVIQWEGGGGGSDQITPWVKWYIQDSFQVSRSNSLADHQPHR